MGRDLKQDATGIFLAAVDAVRPEHLMPRSLRRAGNVLRVGEQEFDLSQFSKIVVVGGGKASAAMAAPLEVILNSGLAGGVVVTKYGHSVPLKRIRVYESGHPVPDERGVQGTAELIKMLEPLGQDDLILCLLSGGGSALLSGFEDAIALKDVQTLSQLLLSSGVPIHEVNVVRKHISAVGGGKLARIAFPATVLTFVLSDVVGDALDTIASGPTVPDPSTFADVDGILTRHALKEKVPGSIRDFLDQGMAGKVPETPKPGDEVFSRCQTFLVGNNRIALAAAEQKAESLGYDARLISSEIQGESRDVARSFALRAKEVREKEVHRRVPVCLLMGGETTVTILGSGTGGRNQEFALSASLEIEGAKGMAILSGGTDGTDGPTEVAGAVVDGSTCVRARRAMLVPEELLRNNDSYSFFRKVGGHLVTGPTMTNVMDIMVALVA